MKELELYKAEIFRHSEEKIKKRRQNRRRLLLCCVPVCLCAVIGMVVLLQSGDNAETEMATQDMLQENVTESVMASTTERFTSVQIHDGSGEILLVEDRAKVGRLYQAITQHYAAADANAAESKIREYSFAEDREGDMYLSVESVPGYEIQFIKDSGDTRNFMLWLDGWLYEFMDGYGKWKNTNAVFLSPEQVAELKSLLTEG